MKPQNISFKHLFKDVRRKSILQTILFFSRLLEKKNFCIKLLKAALKIFIKRKWVFYLCIYIIFSRHLAFSGRELLNKALSGIGVYLFRLTFVLRFFSLWSQACFTLAPEQKHENTRFIKGRYMA